MTEEGGNPENTKMNTHWNWPLLLAADRSGRIGLSSSPSGLPWHAPQDLRRFAALTAGGLLIMGRSTYEHLTRQGRGLKGRTALVVTRSPREALDHLQVTPEELPEQIGQWKQTEEKDGPIWIAGGAQIYEAAWHETPWMDLTLIDLHSEGDVSLHPEGQQLVKACWSAIDEGRRTWTVGEWEVEITGELGGPEKGSRDRQEHVPGYHLRLHRTT